ncbi:hypothetical protein [Rothia nasimurium]|uniref:hypothetical protein n=1 Tax=Rothia nasimurium TaxID=85336 RepID=UPI001F3719C9|nr:hypothetical protein [Rothia nasimurium]
MSKPSGAEPAEPRSESPDAGYSPVPKKRRGHRRATGGSAFTGTEPKLAGLTDPGASAPATEGEDARATWLKEQRPPHYGQ